MRQIVSLALQTQEFQDHRVLDDFGRVYRLFLPACYSQDAFLVIAQQKALVKMAVDLSFQLAGRPVVVGCFELVIFPFGFIINSNDQPVMRPAQFRTHCVRNWK